MRESSGAGSVLVARLAGVYTDEQRFGGLVPADELLATAIEAGESAEAVLDQVGEALARGFGTGDLTYEFCDDLVNHVVIIHYERAGPKDSLFWTVYMAFDAGEFHRPDDDRSVDPVEKYTRPAIAEILAEISP